jgi:hypothetical protein
MNVVKLIANRRLQTGGTSIRNRAARSEAGLLGPFRGATLDRVLYAESLRGERSRRRAELKTA